jgi:hypothetical protein
MTKKEEPFTITTQMEYIRLWEALEVVEKEYKSIYKEFGLDSEISDMYCEALSREANDHEWLEVIDWATTLAQNVRFDLLENGIDIEVMNTLMSSLLNMIEIADRKLLREWEIKR